MTKICPKCGKTLPDNAKYCVDCGFSIGAKANNSSHSSIFLVLIALVVVVGGAVIIATGFTGSVPLDDGVDLTINDVDGWINDEDKNIGRYNLFLKDGDKILDEISIIDYTNDFHQQYDRKERFPRPYAFVVNYCRGWSMSQGFDYDKDYNNHGDENGRHIGGYQGVCTHTLEDIRNWCENFIAQLYLKDYDQTLKTLDIKQQRAEWFTNKGFILDEDRKKNIVSENVFLGETETDMER